MTEPIIVDVPHHLGLEEAKRRVGGGIGKLAGMFPGGAAVEHHWEGDALAFTVTALGQSVACRLEVEAAKIRAIVDLPPFLGLFAGKIRDKLLKEAPKLLK